MITSVPPAGTDRIASSAMRDVAGSPRIAPGDPVGTTSTPAGSTALIELSTTAKAISASASGTKDFATVAEDARAALDAGYAKAGKTSSIYTTGAEWRELFSGLDRRSLYAINSNKGGRFSALEQDMAKTAMQQQMDAVTGQDRPGVGNDNRQLAEMWKNSVKFLDGVSAEEKGSFDWAKQRAAVQFNYELASRGDGEEPEKLDSTNPIVKMVKAAFDSLKELGDPSKQVEDMPLYKQAQQLFGSQQTGSSSTVDINV